MPSLTSLSLQDIAKRFTSEDVFYYVGSTGLEMAWKCEKEFTYMVIFSINEFSELTSPCDIDTLIAAIDESKHFELKVTF